MELTWLVATSLVAVGLSYAFVQRAHRSRLVSWTLLCASLFMLATRDLFRSRRQSRPVSEPGDSSTRSVERADADERRWTPLFVRLRRRVAGWLD